MAWYDETVFYHIYPLGLSGAPAQNAYEAPVHRLREMYPWIDHMSRMGFTALYIGPLFESVGHGYETTDYYKVDSRLGTNEDLKEFVSRCHEKGIRVILDGVFNHTGRDFFAFKDVREHRENSPYKDWYCHVDFWGNNEYNDGFSYENWGGYNLLARLNQRNPQVVDYILQVIRFWVSEFAIDGLRLDAADVLDFDFMRALRRLANEVKPDFWLMGEVIHGEYSRWVNPQMLHAVTDYALHKALYSGHNDHNYFEIAHTVKRTMDMLPGGTRLYNFVDNHDVERIISKLHNRAHYLPVHVLLFTLPGIPSVYYGSELGLEGRKEWGSDASLRPYIDPAVCRNADTDNPYARLISKLAHLHGSCPDLVRGDYRPLHLTTGQFSFARGSVIVAVNNEDRDASFSVEGSGVYKGILSGTEHTASDGRLQIELPPCQAEIFLPVSQEDSQAGTAPESRKAQDEPLFDFSEKTSPSEDAENGLGTAQESAEESTADQETDIPDGLSYQEMSVEQLQAVILQKMSRNGQVTDQMRREVRQNIWRDSLINWANSFR